MIKKKIDDMEYLAEAGSVFTSSMESDLADLERRVRRRVPQASSTVKTVFVVCVMALFAGVTIFSGLYLREEERRPVTGTKEVTVETPDPPETIELDTLVIEENFIRRPVTVAASAGSLVVGSTTAEASEYMAPLNVSSLARDSVDNSDLKYSANAVIKYVHDLKVCNYYTLYFQGGKLLPLNNRGLGAGYAGKEEQVAGRLKTEARDYLHTLLEEGLADYKNGKYLECVAVLRVVAEKTANDINCRFYIGMSYFQMRKYSQAADMLGSCVADPCNVFKEESEFYMALSLINGGKTAEGRSVMKRIAAEKGFYAQRAREFF